MNTVITVVGIILLVLAVRYIIPRLVGLLFRLLLFILKCLFKLLVLFIMLLLYWVKWSMISVPVILIINYVFPDIIDLRICFIVIPVLCVLDMTVLRRLVNHHYYGNSNDGQSSSYTTGEYSSLYVLNKRSKIAHFFLDPSAFTISQKNKIIVEATDSDLEVMGYRKKKNN